MRVGAASLFARATAGLLAIGLVAGCAPAPRVALASAEARARAGAPRQALAAYDRLAARRDVDDGARIEALRRAARLCLGAGDVDGARARLERAVERAAPGLVEPAEFELAELVRIHDHARALNLYYRAAAGARDHRGGAYPYHEAMDRILEGAFRP